MDKKPQVGIAVIIIKDGTILMGKRKGSHGSGTWVFPGGKLDFGESFENCVKREVSEETSLVVNNIRFGAVTNDYFRDEDKHFVTVFMICDYKNGVAKVIEPEKCESWKWYELNKLPEPLFLPIQNLMKLPFNPLSFP